MKGLSSFIWNLQQRHARCEERLQAASLIIFWPCAQHVLFRCKNALAVLQWQNQ